MVTAKKVAKGGGSKRKAVKKTVVLKGSAKKTPKTSTKKIVKEKKVQTKRTVSKLKISKTKKRSIAISDNTQSKKKLSAQTRSNKKTSFTEKLEKISFFKEDLLKETPSTVKQKVVMQKRKKSLLPSLSKASTSLLVLSAARFPANLDTFAIQTARIGGIAMVIMGAFFTLTFAQYIGSNAVLSQIELSGNKAAVVSVSSSASGSVTVSSDSTGNATSSSSQTSSTSSTVNTPSIVDSTDPTAQIYITASEPLSNTVPIQIYTTYAEIVTLGVLYKEDGNREIDLGRAGSISTDVWEYNWDTLTSNANGSLYQDGTYQIVAYVTASDGTVSQFLSTQYYFVENNGSGNNSTSAVSVNSSANSTVQSSGTGTVTTQTTDTQTTTTNNGVTVTESTSTQSSTVLTSAFGSDMQVSLSQKQPLSESVLVSTTIVDATQVKLSITPHGAADYAYLGTAEVKGNTWKFDLQTTEFDNGDYTLKIQALSATSESAVKTQKITVENTTSDSITDLAEVTTPTASLLDPDIILKIKGVEPLSGFSDVYIDVIGAEGVEVSIRRETAGTAMAVRNAYKQTTNKDRWMYHWDTTNFPNGTYYIEARVKNSTGQYFSESILTKIYNEVLYEIDEKKGGEIADDANAVIRDVNATREIEFIKVSSKETSLDYQNSTEEEKKEIQSADIEVRKLLTQYRSELDELFGYLASAIRGNNDPEVEYVKARIEELRTEIIASEIANNRTQEVVRRIDKQLADSIIRVQEAVEKTEKILTERIGEKITKDSDKDGITDYDEVVLYGTNPLVADTDGDGFADGAEILGGFDPNDSDSEAVIIFESPEEEGLVRADILEVYSVVTAVPKITPEADGNDEEAFISGKGLPNSFVRLYIFSTPIVLTVKTDSDGSWKYRFDKELEDGEHTVYVGMTDNTGRIVAKSNPFSFIKEAQAFSAVDPDIVSASSIDVSNDSLLSGYMLYLVLAISVVSIGLVLILLGLHLDTRRKQLAVVSSLPEMT